MYYIVDLYNSWFNGRKRLLMLIQPIKNTYFLFFLSMCLFNAYLRLKIKLTAKPTIRIAPPNPLTRHFAINWQEQKIHRICDRTTRVANTGCTKWRARKSSRIDHVGCEVTFFFFITPKRIRRYMRYTENV